ncbi:DUF4349 domain-containing protein [Anaerolentibacter hominis]|uniref:DUF4349 domain-containing protein n=1 Tax=Anaerolentibacter hominis TaxID=3079009 RepID=UPI0031B84481
MKKKIWYVILALILTAGLLAGCSKSVYETMPQSTDNTASSDSKHDAGMDTEKGEVMDEMETSAPEEAGGGKAIVSNQKIIYRSSLRVETKEFDKLLDFVKDTVSQAGGYMESSEVYGNSYYSSQSYRSANLVIRIPADKRISIIDSISGQSNVLSHSDYAENVTLEYVDTESRLEALRTEQERLLDFLKKAEKMEDVIALEERFSQIRYEIQDYESRKKVLDNQIEYSTISLDIQEVARETSIQNETLGDRIQNGFSDTLYQMRLSAEDFLVWFLSNIIIILIWVAILVIAVLILIKMIRKRSRKKIKKMNTEQTDKEGKDEKKELKE